jgi:leucyl aminopeptidase
MLLWSATMRVSVSDRDATEIAADALLVLFRASERGRLAPPLAAHLRDDAARLLARRTDATTWLETRNLPTSRVLFLCLGPELQEPEPGELGGLAGTYDRSTAALALHRALRNAGAALERACNQAGIRHAALVAWPADHDPLWFVEGMCLRAHDPRAWEHAADGPTATSLRKLSICVDQSWGVGKEKSPRRELDKRLRENLKIIDATNFARELGDLPSNLGTARALVERVRDQISAHELQLDLSTISAAEAQAAGMGLFAAVDAGARERGCILRLDWRGSSKRPPLVLIGKGLTHDTGGYNLKRGIKVHQLTHDKCGAMAVIGAMLAIAELQLPMPVVAFCPLTENSVDANAYKPGDILTACNGTTVYIENTDAEGRLVLADVLAYVANRGPEPELIIDLATLTGEQHAALGEPFAGLYCNDDRARDVLVAAGHASGDLVWPMPIHDMHDSVLGHHKADLRNVGASAGAPSCAAAFLRAFVDAPWAHVDLAGKAYVESARECWGPGATGFGCRLLVEVTRRLG